MISAKDLMIGDWVKFPIGNEKIIDLPYIPGKGICASFAASATLFPVEVEKLEPIPLTAEIIEKNGFGFTRNDNTDSVWNGWWIYKGLELATACLNRDEKWPCFINIYDSNIKCEYVHQLQHALRLCEIEKEITL